MPTGIIKSINLEVGILNRILIKKKTENLKVDNIRDVARVKAITNQESGA